MLARPSRRIAATAPELNLKLHPKQWTAFESAASEILYGGAAGGGKSHLMRVAAITWCAAIKGLQVYFFRRIREDLIKNHMEGPKGFRSLLANWSVSGLVDIVEDEIRFWNGSKIYLCHCKDEKDRFKYHGAEIHVLCIDELTHFTELIYRFLRNRVRMVGVSVPAEYIGRFPRILGSANPGNLGHLWVKQTFINEAQPFALRKMPNAEGGMLRQFIPARLEDNPSMLEDDPGYEGRLEGLGSKSLVSAMRWGDWDVIEGAFFDCWDARKHVVAPFNIPHDWLRFRSGDWGSASPFSIGWWAVAQDDYHLRCGMDGLPGREWSDTPVLSDIRLCNGESAAGRSNTLPRGALIRYREDYGDQDGKPGAGLKLTAEAVAERIIEREKNDPKLTYGVLDPSAFKEDGGPSIAERINTKLVRAKIAPFRPADNSRVATLQSHDRRGPMGGWDQLRARMIGQDGTPMIFVFSTCLDFIRTVPVLQHDPHKAEDLDTNAEDHCFVAGTCVATPEGPIAIDELPAVGMVWDANGVLRPYRNPRMTRKAVPVVRLEFDDGSTVTCTPQHRFKTIDGRWIEAAKMLNEASYACMLPAWTGRSSLAKMCKSFWGVDTINAGAISSGADHGSIGQSGAHSMDRSLVALISTIRTVIASTIPRIILNVLIVLRIWPIMDACAQGTQQLLWQSTPDQPHRSGTARKRADLGIPNIGARTSSPRWIGGNADNANSAVRSFKGVSSLIAFVQTRVKQRIDEIIKSITFTANASSAGKPFLSMNILNKSHARANAEELVPVECGRVCRSLSAAGKADVYCLTVPDAGSFLLANGVAVANCADETRYAVMSRPWLKTKEPPPVPKDLYVPASELIDSNNFKLL